MTVLAAVLPGGEVERRRLVDVAAVPAGVGLHEALADRRRAGDVDDERLDLVRRDAARQPEVDRGTGRQRLAGAVAARVEHALRRVEPDEPAVGREAAGRGREVPEHVDDRVAAGVRVDADRTALADRDDREVGTRLRSGVEVEARERTDGRGVRRKCLAVPGAGGAGEREVDRDRRHTRRRDAGDAGDRDVEDLARPERADEIRRSDRSRRAGVEDPRRRAERHVPRRLVRDGRRRRRRETELAGAEEVVGAARTAVDDRCCATGRRARGRRRRGWRRAAARHRRRRPAPTRWCPRTWKPNVVLSNPDAADMSGLIRPSLVGPCELYVPSVPLPGGSTAPTAITPALRESTIDVAAENWAWTCCSIPSP